MALWAPIPPPGYVALGCCATSGADNPPPLVGLVACVAACACVEARPSECLLLSAAGHIWAVANACASLAVVPSGGQQGGEPQPQQQQQQQLWDLRSPLGVSPSARANEQQLRLQRAGMTAEKALQLEEVEDARVPLSMLLQEKWVRVCLQQQQQQQEHLPR